MHYKRKRQPREKSTTFWIDSALLGFIGELACFYHQTPSRILEQGILWARIDNGGDYEKIFEKSTKNYKKEVRIQRKKDESSISKARSEAEENVAKLPFE